MSEKTSVLQSDSDNVLSEYLGQQDAWSTKRYELYTALVKKGFSIESEVEAGITTVSVTAFGFTVSARHSEPFNALALAAVKAINFHKEASAGAISLPKTNIPLSIAYHWLLRGLDIRRSAWQGNRYVSLELGRVADKSMVSGFLPDELFAFSSDANIAVMPRLVMTDREQQARYDWCAIGVDIMATDWEVF